MRDTCRIDPTTRRDPMQQHTLDGLHATFREREQRALNAAHRYRQAKQIQAARTATQQPDPAASTATGRRRFAIHVPRPIRMWLLSVLLLTSACGGALAVPPDDIDTSSGTPLVYQDCFRGNPPQIC
jgi:hypothetical protein